MRTPPSPDVDGRPEIVAFDCIDDDGRFCVVRTTSAEADIHDADDVFLSVAWQDREYRFTPVELDAEAADDRSAEFLLPARLLEDGIFILHRGGRRVLLGLPTRHLPGTASGLSTEQALLVQQDQLVDQARRLTNLRTDMRRLHDRAVTAEDALDDAHSRFEVALIGQRGEVQDARRHAAEVEAALSAAEERAATAEERAATVEADAATARDARADAEIRLTWAEAQVEAAQRDAERERQARSEAEEALESRVGEVDDLVRARTEEIEAEKAALGEREAELEARLDDLVAHRAEELDAAGAANVEQQEALRTALDAERALRVDDRVRLEEKTGRICALEEELERTRAANAHVSARLKSAEQALAEKHAPERRAPTVGATMGARLIALDMAMKGTPREETARYLGETFELVDSTELLDEVYGERVGA